MVRFTKIRFLRVLAALAATGLVPGCLDAPSSVQDGLPAPSGLSAVALPDGAAIQLSWSDNSSNESSFRIDVSAGPIVADTDVTEWTTVPSNVTSYTYVAVPNATRYFRVLAVTPLHQSVPSNVASATTPNVPSAPGRLDALVGPNGSDVNVTIAWDDVANETGYAVERSTDGASWTSVAALGQDTTSYVDATTVYSRSYAYRVRGINATGAGPWAPAAWTQTRNLSWDRLSAATAGNTSWNVSLAVYAGTAVVAAYDSTYGDIVQGFTYYGSSSLGATTINPGFPESLGYGSTSIAVDGTGRYHIVAADAFNDVLYHVTNETGGVWQAYAIDSATDSDKAVIRKAPNGTLHVVYQHTAGPTRGLRYAVRAGSTWSSEWITSLESTDYFDFAIDAAGMPHVVYRRSIGSGLHDLAHAWKAPSAAWAVVALPTQADPEMCSLATDASNRLYVAYNSTASGALHLLTDAGGSWAGETVHRSPRGSWGRYNSVVVGDGGMIHIAYYDNLYGALRYASRMPGKAWTHQLIDGVGDVGRHASIGRDPDVGLFIAYGDATNGRMKVAMSWLRAPSGLIASPASTTQIQLTWTDTPNETGYRVERSADGGATWASLATLPAGSVAYGDTGLEPSQVYTYRVVGLNDFGSSDPSNPASALPAYISTVSFPASTDFGLYNDLAVGPAGQIHVAHLDQTNADTLYTTGLPGGPFTTLTADAGPLSNSPVGSGSNGIALAGSQIAIVDQLAAAGAGTTSGLRFTTVTGTAPASAMLETTPPFASSYGYYPKIRTAPDGTLHVLHMESVSGGWHWRHAYRSGTIWTLAGRITPQEFLWPQYNNSLAVASDGTPHFAYIKSSTFGGPQELVYGSRQGGAWSFSVVAGPVDPFYVSLALDGAGKAHVAYLQGGVAMAYGTNATGAWAFETVRSPVYHIANLNPAIAVDAGSGRIHLVYGDSGLWHLRKDPGGSWVRKPLDLSGTMTHISLGLGAGGMIHVAYYDANAKRLKILSAEP